MNNITIPKDEYIRLKKLDERFSDLWRYMEYLSHIQNSRQQIKEKKIISQERLFKQLGF